MAFVGLPVLVRSLGWMEDVGQGFSVPTSAWTASIRWDSFALISSARDEDEGYKEKGICIGRANVAFEVHVAWCERNDFRVVGDDAM